MKKTVRLLLGLMVVVAFLHAESLPDISIKGADAIKKNITNAKKPEKEESFKLIQAGDKFAKLNLSAYSDEFFTFKQGTYNQEKVCDEILTARSTTESLPLNIPDVREVIKDSGIYSIFSTLFLHKNGRSVLLYAYQSGEEAKLSYIGNDKKSVLRYYEADAPPGYRRFHFQCRNYTLSYVFAGCEDNAMVTSSSLERNHE